MRDRTQLRDCSYLILAFIIGQALTPKLVREPMLQIVALVCHSTCLPRLFPADFATSSC
jgi:hypothetical protein